MIDWLIDWALSIRGTPTKLLKHFLLYHFRSLSTSHTPCLCSIQRRWYNYSFKNNTVLILFSVYIIQIMYTVYFRWVHLQYTQRATEGCHMTLATYGVLPSAVRKGCLLARVLQHCTLHMCRNTCNNVMSVVNMHVTIHWKYSQYLIGLIYIWLVWTSNIYLSW